MQNLLYPGPLFIRIESIKHYFQRKEKVWSIGALLDRFQRGELNFACFNSFCFHLVSCALPCFISIGSAKCYGGVSPGGCHPGGCHCVLWSEEWSKPSPTQTREWAWTSSTYWCQACCAFPLNFLPPSSWSTFPGCWLCSGLPYHSTCCLALPKLGGQCLLGCIPGHWTPVPPYLSSWLTSTHVYHWELGATSLLPGWLHS